MKALQIWEIFAVVNVLLKWHSHGELAFLGPATMTRGALGIVRSAGSASSTIKGPELYTCSATFSTALAKKVVSFGSNSVI